MEELSLLDSEGKKKSHEPVIHHSQRPESPVCPLQQEANTPEPQDSSRLTGEEGEEESDSSGLQIEETSVLTNGELSEEEEAMLSGNKSILPSSLLDQAHVIAEGFVNNLSRRSSLVSEDLGSLACPSPLMDSDSLKSHSACLDLETGVLSSSSPEPQVTSVNLSPTAHEPMRMVVEGERMSTLSKQDRLLIHKIRRYYEHAENQDANFSIKRRESLSYIPAGLVRNLSRQLNSGPEDQPVPVCRKDLSRNRPTSWSVFDLPGIEKSQNMESYQIPEAQRTPVQSNVRSQSVTDSCTTEETITPSTDMLKVWKDLEMEEENQEVQQSGGESLNDSRIEAILDVLDVKTSKDPFHALKESEKSLDSSISSPTTTFPAVEGESVSECQTSPSQEKNHFNRSHLPKIINFRKSVDEDQILEDMGKMKNKVFQLARQYSQRIKNNRPMVWQKNRETANQQGFRKMAVVREEKKGKHETQWLYFAFA